MASQLEAYKNDSLPDEEAFKHICEVLGRVEQKAEEVVTEALPIKHRLRLNSRR